MWTEGNRRNWVFITFGWVTWPLQWLVGHFLSMFCTWPQKKLPRELWRLDQYAIIVVMHYQQFWPSNSPDQRKSRNRNLVYMAETEDYLNYHAWTTHYFSKLPILLLLHSFFHDWNQLWGEGDTGATYFGFKVFLNKDSCQSKLVFLCPILEWKLIGLESVDVLRVDIETKQVKTRAASNLVAIFLLTWIWIAKTQVHFLSWCM